MILYGHSPKLHRTGAIGSRNIVDDRYCSLPGRHDLFVVGAQTCSHFRRKAGVYRVALELTGIEFNTVAGNVAPDNISVMILCIDEEYGVGNVLENQIKESHGLLQFDWSECHPNNGRPS